MVSLSATSSPHHSLIWHPQLSLFHHSWPSCNPTNDTMKLSHHLSVHLAFFGGATLIMVKTHYPKEHCLQIPFLVKYYIILNYMHLTWEHPNT